VSCVGLYGGGGGVGRVEVNEWVVATFILESLGARVSIHDGVRICVVGGFFLFFFRSVVLCDVVWCYREVIVKTR